MAHRKMSGKGPVYPSISKTNREEGLVILDVIVNEQGKVEDLKVLEAPSDRLGSATVSAVRSWKFDPYMQNGVPTKVETTVEVFFPFAN